MLAPTAFAQESASGLAAPRGDNSAADTDPASTEILDTEVPPVPEATPSSYQSEDDELRVPARIAARIRVLDSNLRSLSERRGNSIVDGILSMLSGGLSITLGVLVPGDEQFLANYLFVWGSANIVRGVVDIALTPRSEDAAIEFSNMPMTTVAEVRQRLRFGEDALESIAHRARLSRIIESSINIAAGVAVVPLYLGPSNFEIQSPVDYFVLIGSGVSVIAGVVSLVTKSQAERRLEAYQELRERLNRQRRQASFRIGVAPDPNGGGLATLQATF